MVGEPDADPLVTFDWTTFDSPSTAVVTAVAETADRDPTTIDPLYEVVDPDALDDIVASTCYPRGTPDARIEFLYHGYRVLVKANGRGFLYGRDDVPLSTDGSLPFEARRQAN